MIFLSDLLCRFDTYRSKDESRRLAQYVEAVEDGQILAMMVNDEGSNNLEDSARKTLARLGSHHFHRLGFRYRFRSLTESQRRRASPDIFPHNAQNLSKHQSGNVTGPEPVSASSVTMNCHEINL